MRDFPILSWLEGLGLGVPVHVENDVNAIVRSAIEHPNAININLGTGIGVAIKRDGLIEHIGNNWDCYQMGHGFRWRFPEEMTRKCACGSIGCLEAIVGARALAERYWVRPEQAPPETYEKMRRDVIDYLSPAIADTVEKFGIHTVLLSGSAARGYQSNFDFIGSLANRIHETRSDTEPIEFDFIRSPDIAALHGAALALLDYCAV